MERTTISLPAELLERVRRLAARRHTSVAAVVREALEEKTANGASQVAVDEGGPRPKPHLGVFASGRSDLSELVSSEEWEATAWRSS